MKKFTRAKLGVALAVFAIAIIVTLASAGVPLVTHSTTAFVTPTGATVSDEATKVHWALVPPAMLFMVAAVLVAISRHDNAA